MRTDGYMTFNNRKYRITNARRFRVFMVVLLIIGLGLVSVLSGFISAEAATANEPVEYVVESGDSLWSVASQYTDNDTDVRETVYKIRKANNLTDAGLTAGQTIEIPVN
ncbi:MAG: LysM peptidoglycan-binding domain-containing protein [Eubacteriales bacterium]|nr:LysM peptidoglycan-binding domain-containing protein [Eubacteriales bacterium]